MLYVRGYDTVKENHRLAPHVVLLRELFAARGVRFGTPQNLPAFVAYLSSSRSFHHDVYLTLRTILYLEGLALTRADLLRILTVAVGGLHAVEGALEACHLVTLDALTEEVFVRLEEPSSKSVGDARANVDAPDAAAESLDRPDLDDLELGSIRRSPSVPLLPRPHRGAILSRPALLSMVAVSLILGTACFLEPTQQKALAHRAALHLAAATGPRTGDTARHEETAGRGPGQPPWSEKLQGDTLPRAQVFNIVSQRMGPVRPQSTPGLAEESAANQETTEGEEATDPESLPAGEGEPNQFHFHPVPELHAGSSIISAGAVAAKVLYAPLPQYPAPAALTHVQGDVVLQVDVGRDGTVVATRIVRGQPLLRGAAEDAVRHWRYRPQSEGADQTPTTLEVRLDFHLAP